MSETCFVRIDNLSSEQACDASAFRTLISCDRLAQPHILLYNPHQTPNFSCIVEFLSPFDAELAVDDLNTAFVGGDIAARLATEEDLANRPTHEDSEILDAYNELSVGAVKQLRNMIKMQDGLNNDELEMKFSLPGGGMFSDIVAKKGNKIWERLKLLVKGDCEMLFVGVFPVAVSEAIENKPIKPAVYQAGKKPNVEEREGHTISTPAENSAEIQAVDHHSQTTQEHKSRPSGLGIAGYYSIEKIKQLIPTEYHQEVKMLRQKAQDHAFTICVFKDPHTAKKIFSSIPNEFTTINRANIIVVHDEIHPLAHITATMEEMILHEAEEAENAAAAAAAQQRFQESIQAPKSPSTVVSDCDSDGVGVSLAETSFNGVTLEPSAVPENVDEDDFNDFLDDIAGYSDEAAESSKPVGQVTPSQEEALGLMGELAFNDEPEVPQNMPVAQENRVVKVVAIPPKQQQKKRKPKKTRKFRDYSHKPPMSAMDVMKLEAVIRRAANRSFFKLSRDPNTALSQIPGAERDIAFELLVKTALAIRKAEV